MLKISIITVVFNGVNTLEQTIESVINQGYKDIEYIIIDGGSSDGTVDLIKKYDNYLAYWESEKDGGIYYAMNKGLQHASGDIIGIINCDDWYEANAFEEVSSFFCREPETQIIAGQINEIDTEGNSRTSKRSNIDDIWFFMPIKHPATFFRKKLYDSYGGFDTRYRIAADYDFFFRLYLNGITFKTVDNVWTNFRSDGVSSTEIIATTLESISIKKKYFAHAENRIDARYFDRYNLYQINMAYLEQDLYQTGILTDRVLKTVFKDGIYIYGCGKWGRQIIKKCITANIQVKGIFDGNTGLLGENIQGIKVSNPTELANINGKLLVAIYFMSDEMVDRLCSICNEKLEIIKLFDLAVKVMELNEIEHIYERNTI